MASASSQIKKHLAHLTTEPGVYRMLSEHGKILYIGKARNLKNRVTSYFRKTVDSPKTQALVKQIQNFEITITNTEAEALILEQNLIKTHRPRFNILLRDDKSYPYIFLSNDKYPRLTLHRGAKRAKGKYFGPFPGVGSAKESLNLLQKLFQVRQCENSYFAHRSRACLQYQIKRCTAPCVEAISETDYAKDVAMTRLFYQGHNEQVIDDLAIRMEEASDKLAFEEAARYRDQISSMRDLIQQQVVERGSGDLDVIAMARNAGLVCIQLLFIRQGRVLGSHSYFQSLKRDFTDSEILETFVSQYYLKGTKIPSEIVVKMVAKGAKVISQVLSEIAEHQVKISANVREMRQQWLKMATTNAENALSTRLASNQTIKSRFQALSKILGLQCVPERMECFDISHTSGEQTVASCVVFGLEGPINSLYRRFNIKDITGGDDFAAMHQVLQRRYKRVKSGELEVPDILVVDGGKGQLKQAELVLDELGVEIPVVIGIAKGRTRKAGFEQLFIPGQANPVVMEADEPALHLLQHIRDESHRFAISGHRAKRAKVKKASPLESIEGIGAVRRRELLRRFGGLQGIKQATISDLKRIPGINQTLAENIHNRFHE
ncbi:MAG: excinuclease ABC subunit UvrC [Gammaproteobacteria bacterium]|nr:excinuclease ABC subunit UvrC [Gammaproteobacteria bacterium]